MPIKYSVPAAVADVWAIKQHELDRLAEKLHATLLLADYDEAILTAF